MAKYIKTEDGYKLMTELDDYSQPDWNQTDESATDYIKNRPFYKVEAFNNIIGNTRVSFASGVDRVYVYPDFEKIQYIQFNNTIYRVYWNGIPYSCESYYGKIGNSSLWSSTEADTKEPFFLWFDENYLLVFRDLNISSAEEIIELSIDEDNTYIKPISSEFIPSMAGRNVAGEDFFYNGEYYTASDGAEIFNSKNNIATGTDSHAEGCETVALDYFAHAEGVFTKAFGNASHAEGRGSTADGSSSHAEGNGTQANGNQSHAEGNNTIATTENQHVQGSYNVKDTQLIYAHIVGNGTADNNRSNAHTLDWDGNTWFAGDVYVGSTSGTNKDDGSKKLATEEYVDNHINIELPEVSSDDNGSFLRVVDGEWGVANDPNPYKITVQVNGDYHDTSITSFVDMSDAAKEQFISNYNYMADTGSGLNDFSPQVIRSFTQNSDYMTYVIPAKLIGSSYSVSGQTFQSIIVQYEYCYKNDMANWVQVLGEIHLIVENDQLKTGSSEEVELYTKQ